MADRTVTVRLKAEVASFKQGMRESAREVEAVGKKTEQTSLKSQTALGKMAESAHKNAAEWTQVGTAVTAAGVAMTAVLVGSAKAAIDWETAFTGVLKTVEGTPEQLAAIEQGLRSMARELPVSHAELAAVAEAAGQLGVQTDSILDFTRTMVDLGQTTNLTADEAATSIAQLMNIMQSAPEDVDNLGSALVALGNNGASTERDIIQMAQRIAGAGKIVGLTEDQVLALANALASVGIEVEAGGSAISRVMTDMAKAVSTGSDDLGEFAKVAGVSGDEFAAAWKADPAEALTLFIEGLGRMNAAGGDVFSTLDKLGQSDVRVSRALLGMAGSGDLLRESLVLGNEAWDENTALQDEAAKRYETTAAQLSTMKNQFVDAGISIGQVFLPVIGGMAKGLGAVADFLGGMPGPARTLTGGILALAAAVTLASGGFLLLAPRILVTKNAMRELGITSAVARGQLAAASSFMAGPWGVAILGGISLLGLFASGQNNTTRATEDWTNSLTFQGRVLDDNGKKILAQQLASEGLLDAVDELGLSEAQFLDLIQKGGPELDRLIDRVLGLDRANVTAAGSADGLDAVMGRLGPGLDEVAGTTDDYSAAAQGAVVRAAALAEQVGLVRNASSQAAAATGENAEKTTDLAEASKDAADEVKELRERLDELSKGYVDYETATINYQESVDDLAKALKENGTTLDKGSEKGRANRKALMDLRDDTLDLVVATKQRTESDEEARDAMVKGRAELVKQAQAFDMTEEEAEKYATELGLIPDNVATIVELNKAKAETDLNAFLRKVNRKHVATVEMRAEKQAERHAGGGYISGPGGPTDDLIPALLSNGEYVIRASAVDKYGTSLLDEINAARFAQGGSVGDATFAPLRLASGGPVDLGGLLSSYRDLIGVITWETRTAAKKAHGDAKVQVKDRARDLRDAKRSLRDTRESNADRLAAARADVRAAKTAKERKAAEKALRRVQRDNAEDLENATYRVTQSEKGLKVARTEAAAAAKAAAKADKDYAKGKVSQTTMLGQALGKDIKDTDTFIKNISTLAGRGHTNLAASLLAQGDEALAADAVKASDKQLAGIESQVKKSQAQQAKIAALPQVFELLKLLAKNKNLGVSQASWALGVNMLELQTAAATATDLIKAAGGNTFLAEMKKNGYARGGLVTGGSGPFADDGGFVSKDEFVVRAAVTRQPGVVPFLTALNDGATKIHGSRSLTVQVSQHNENHFDGITDVRELDARFDATLGVNNRKLLAAINEGIGTAA